MTADTIKKFPANRILNVPPFIVTSSYFHRRKDLYIRQCTSEIRLHVLWSLISGVYCPQMGIELSPSPMVKYYNFSFISYSTMELHRKAIDIEKASKVFMAVKSYMC